jgi:predicted ester cyclase
MRFSDFWLIKEGKLAENWVMVDNLAVLHQIGACSLDWKFVNEIVRSQENIKTFCGIEKNSRSVTQNIELVKSMCDALIAPEHDLAAQKKFWNEDMIWHGPPGFGDIYTLPGFLKYELSVFYEAFPDFDGDFDIFFGDGNWVAAPGYVTGTHEGDWLGIPATGKTIKMRYSDFWLIREGKLSENWVMLDHLGVLKQMGIDPIENKF